MTNLFSDQCNYTEDEKVTLWPIPAFTTFAGCIKQKKSEAYLHLVTALLNDQAADPNCGCWMRITTK